MTAILHRIGFLSLLLIFFAGGQLLHAQKDFYYYKQLGVKDGLSQSKVQCILSDHKGYLWIGTESGLNCYDRAELKQYMHRDGDEHSLPSNNISFITEDSLQNLWVGTAAGVCRYHHKSDDFTPVKAGGQLLYAPSCLMVEDGVLFGGVGVVYKYVYATRKIQTIYSATDNNALFAFYEMVRYDEEHILINTRWHGIYFFNLKDASMERLEMFAGNNYTCIYLDSYHRLWVSAYGNGLYCYEGEKLIRHFTTENSPLTYNVIHDIIEKDNLLWVATDGEGINLISLDNFSFSSIRHTEGDIQSFPTNTIFHLYADAEGNMWAGSIRNGLIGMKSVYAYNYRAVPFGNAYGLSNPSVNCLLQDADGTVWLGTDGGGINRFDVETGTFVHYASTRDDKVSSMLEYSPSELLYYSFNKGIFLFHKQTGQVRPFLLLNAQTNNWASMNGFAINMQRIAPGKIMFCAQHIFIFDINTHKLEVVADIGKDYIRNSPLVIATVGHKTYLADVSNLCEYDAAARTFKTIYQGEALINDACLGQDDTFWLATENGLVCYDPQTRTADKVSTDLFQEAMSVVADLHGRIWVGTRRQLYAYFPQNRNFVIQDEVDGVLPNEYIFHSTLRTKEGLVMLGGTEGLTLVKPGVRVFSGVKHSIELLDVWVDGLPVSTDDAEVELPLKLNVPWNFSTLQLKVLLNDKDVFRKNLFRFYVGDTAQTPIESKDNSITLNQLPADEYVISASYYTRNGAWSTPQQILQLTVSPPWWKTTWAYILFVLLVFLLLYGVAYYFYRRKRISQMREITRLKNNAYEEKINFLTHISHELRTPLTLICAPLKRLLDHETEKEEPEEVEKVLQSVYKQANQMKSIIDMVLDVRRLEEGKDMLHILPHALNDWVRGVGNKFALEYEAKGVILSFRLDGEIKEVPFDEGKCEFVLSNFLMNALKFSEAGTTTMLITSLSDDKRWVRVAVQDEGMGLNGVDIDSLFTNFYQGNHEKGGSGLGLAYSKSLITYHKGRIGAENAEGGRGSLFFFDLPLEETVQAVPASMPVSVPNTAEMKGHLNAEDYNFLKKYSVIVAEDAADLRNYLKDTLSRYFNKVYVAKDGKDALELIKQRLPDIIISDMMMPRINGIDLCREVKSDLNISHIPFILLTAYYNSQNMYAGYKMGADAFLPKPFEIDSLLALVGNQLKLRENIRARYIHDEVLTTQDISFSNADETFLSKLNALILENITNPDLNVAFLSSNMYVSRSLLFNKVKAITGMGIVDYVNKLRIDRAVILLVTTDLSLTEISEMVGFSSLRYFSKVFKHVKGEIPSAYRKRGKG